MRKIVIGKVVSRRKVLSRLVNAGGLQLECARVLHESLLIPVIYGNETMI